MGDVFIFRVVAQGFGMSRLPLVTLTPSAAAHAPTEWVIAAHRAPSERERTQKGHFSPPPGKQQNAKSVVAFANGLGFKVLKVSWARRRLSCCADSKNQL